jgi:hypothetical protein
LKGYLFTTGSLLAVEEGAAEDASASTSLSIGDMKA